MAFYLKKIVSVFFMPLPLSLVLFSYGLYLLMFTRRQKAGRFFSVSAAIWLALISYHPFTDMMLGPLEKTYQPYISSSRLFHFVVVLGGGHGIDMTRPITNRINSSSLYRLLEGIRIYRLNRGSKIVFTGWEGVTNVPMAVIMADIARSAGVNPEDIIMEPDPKDTTEEARSVKNIVGDKPFVLVTSASHMKRAMALFKHEGLDPFPAPTDFHVQEPSDYLACPSAGSIENADRACHEYLGLVWSKMTGQI